MKLPCIRTCVLLTMLSTFTIGVPRATPQKSSNEISEFEAQALVATIDTAQAELRLAKQPYAPLVKLLEHRHIAGSWIAPTLTDDYTGTIQNYKVSVLASEDGRHYTVAVVPEPATRCGPTFFSSEAGPIYRGQALGCPEGAN